MSLNDLVDYRSCKIKKRNMKMIEQYVNAAIRHGQYSVQGDHEAANLAHDELLSVLKQIRQLPDRGEQLLRGLLVDKNRFVVCWAATHLLPISSHEARQALMRVMEEDSNGLAGLNAKMVLQEWDSGRLVIDQ